MTSLHAELTREAQWPREGAPRARAVGVNDSKSVDHSKLQSTREEVMSFESSLFVFNIIYLIVSVYVS